MAFTDRKLETGILVLSVVLLGGLGYVLKTPVQNVVIAGQDFVYEMPRIKKSFLASLFDLGDREIERTYKNPFAKKQAAEKKKAEETKKAQAAAAAAAKGAAKTAAKVEGKKPKVEINTVQAVPAKTWGDDSLQTTAAHHGGQYGGTASVGGEGTTGEKADDKNKMSGDQWRALLSAQPTAENVAKLIQAFSKEEIDAASYYVIVEDLFKSNNDETQKLGLMAAKPFYNYQSFTLVSQYMNELSVADEAEAYLFSYGTSSRLGVLAMVMKGADSKAVAQAIEVALMGYNNAKDGTPLSGDPRKGRGDVITNSLSGYQQIRVVIEGLANHADPTVKSLVDAALSQIPSSITSTVASN